jgi:hypothetical protein
MERRSKREDEKLSTEAGQLQMSLLEIHVLPQALPTVQILQHANALVMAVDDLLNPKAAGV